MLPSLPAELKYSAPSAVTALTAWAIGPSWNGRLVVVEDVVDDHVAVGVEAQRADVVGERARR